MRKSRTSAAGWLMQSMSRVEMAKGVGFGLAVMAGLAACMMFAGFIASVLG
jgi:hypothetical protein